MLLADVDDDKRVLAKFIEYFFELATSILISFIELGIDNALIKSPVLKLHDAITFCGLING